MKSYIKGISEQYGDYLCDICRNRCFHIIHTEGKDYCIDCLENFTKKAKKHRYEQSIRHQVCEEIREKLNKMLELDNSAWDERSEECYTTLTIYGVKCVLDQIEQGESK